MSAQPTFPVPKERSISYVLNHPPVESYLPQGRTVFSISIDKRGEPSVQSATIRLFWPDSDQEIAKSSVFSSGVIVVDHDASGRVIAVEATAYVAGPIFISDVIEEHNRQLLSGKPSHLLTAIGTMMVYWPRVDASFKRMAAETPHPLAIAERLKAASSGSDGWEVRRDEATRDLAWVMR